MASRHFTDLRYSKNDTHTSQDKYLETEAVCSFEKSEHRISTCCKNQKQGQQQNRTFFIQISDAPLTLFGGRISIT